ncbi:MAG: hypothetical protein IPG96_09345 [Proteobacteria bacterium]|nr:hypothetical protein [Pseudomonadota bacterium]
MKQLLAAKRTLGLALLATTLALGPMQNAYAFGGGAEALPGAGRPGPIRRGLAAANAALVEPLRKGSFERYGHNVRAAWRGEAPAANLAHAGDYDVAASSFSVRGLGSTARHERRRSEFTAAHNGQGGAYETFAAADAHFEPTRNTTMSGLELAFTRGWVPRDVKDQVLERLQNSPDPVAARAAVKAYLEATRDAALLKIKADYETTLAALPLSRLLARHRAEIAYRRNRAACMAFFGSATRFQWVANAAPSGWVTLGNHGAIATIDRQLKAPAKAAEKATALAKSAERWAPGAGLRRTVVAGVTLATAGLVFAMLSPVTLPAMAGMVFTGQFTTLLAAMGGAVGATVVGGLTVAGAWTAHRLAGAASDARATRLQEQAERMNAVTTSTARMTRQQLGEEAAPAALNDAPAPPMLEAQPSAAQQVAAGAQAGKKQGLLSRFVGSMFGRRPTAPQLATQ